MSGISAMSPTLFVLSGSTNVRIEMPKGPNTSSRFGEASQWSTSSTSWKIITVATRASAFPLHLELISIRGPTIDHLQLGLDEASDSSYFTLLGRSKGPFAFGEQRTSLATSSTIGCLVGPRIV